MLNPKTIDGFKEKWGEMYGDQIGTLVSDLKSGELTPLVKQHLFTDLSNFQPTTQSEMTKWALENPNGRILYMLKSFTLKQFDIVRREIVQKAPNQSALKTTKDLGALALWLGGANLATDTMKDLMKGRTVDPSDLPENAMWSLLSPFGLNKFMGETQLGQGKITDAIVGTVAPAAPLVDALGYAATQPFKKKPNYAKAGRNIPVIGALAYEWLGGGKEEWAKKKRKERRRR